MCKYCEEIGLYNGYGTSPILLSEEVSFGRNYGWLFESFITTNNHSNKTVWQFDIQTTDGFGGTDDSYIHIGQFQIQYCPFCGQKLKELAE